MKYLVPEDLSQDLQDLQLTPTHETFCLNVLLLLIGGTRRWAIHRLLSVVFLFLLLFVCSNLYLMSMQ